MNKTDRKNKKPAAKAANTPKKYKSFRLQKRIKHERQGKITGSFRLFRDSLSFFYQYWKLFGGIVLIYFILTIVFVGIGEGGNISELKEGLGEVLGEELSQLGLGVALFANLVGTSGAPSSGSSIFQLILAVIMSLATIWILRQLMSGRMVSVRDGLYKGMYPLVPFLLVLFVVGLQLIPIAIASFFYSVMIVGGLAVNFLEQFIWALFIFLLVVLSLYMITSSVFAIYIVTLPDMRPMQALRSARELVRHRRWSVMRRLLFLPFSALLIAALITIPVILILPAAAQWVLLLLNLAGLVFTHIYIYSLYKELL